jgi:hypothetical protein
MCYDCFPANPSLSPLMFIFPSDLMLSSAVITASINYFRFIYKEGTISEKGLHTRFCILKMFALFF